MKAKYLQNYVSSIKELSGENNVYRLTNKYSLLKTRFRNDNSYIHCSLSPDRLTQKATYPKYCMTVSEKKKDLILDSFSSVLMSILQISGEKKLPTYPLGKL